MDDQNEKEFYKVLKWAFAEVQGSSAYSLDRDRPYDGQDHTDTGERGKQLVQGVTMRDICDCMVRAFLSCAMMERENPIRDDIYSIPDLNELDPGAVIQQTTCNIERMMGIFPNGPGLKPSRFGYTEEEHDRQVFKDACKTFGKFKKVIVRLFGKKISDKKTSGITAYQYRGVTYITDMIVEAEGKP